MWQAVAVVGGLGCLSALGLGIASLRFKAESDPRVETLEGALPGVNCGACGYAGCAALARALATGDAPTTACVPGGAEVAAVVAGILGVEPGDVLARVAVVHCRGERGVAPDKGVYLGVPDCRAADLVGGGPKRCDRGCLGFGTCERVCPFDAIHVTPGGVARVERTRCTGCGACVEVCPRRLIDLRSPSLEVHVRCSNPGKGKGVKAVCSRGCIGCRKCEKTCPVGAISMRQDLAQIDPDLCVSCGLCAEVCPTTNIDDPVADRHRAEIDEATCIGCGKCARVCPVEAIEGEKKAAHRVDAARCIACGRCFGVCPVDAVVAGALRGGDRPEAA